MVLVKIIYDFCNKHQYVCENFTSSANATLDEKNYHSVIRNIVFPIPIHLQKKHKIGINLI